jgi:UDP-2,3-diacylglucosamine hydrolase
MTSSSKILGLIAGNGKFPFLFAREARRKNYRVIAVAIKKDTSLWLGMFVDKVIWVGPGQLRKLFDWFHAQGVQDVIMAGQVSQKNLFDDALPVDEEFIKLFEALEDRKADTIFKAIADKLNQEGMRLLDSTLLLKDYLAVQGVLTDRQPTSEEEEDILFGVKIAKQMGEIDVGQTVVIKKKAIVAIEAMEGTDRTIYRGGQIARHGAVVIKTSKPSQDLRFDVPVIGPRTIKMMIKSRASCLAVEAGKTLIIDQAKCLQLANRHNIVMKCF